MRNHTIAICTKNRTKTVSAAIHSALANPDTTVIVVDQNDDDRVADLLSEFESAHLVHLRTPIAGAGRARNLAVEASQTPIVCFTDDDCVVPTDYAERMEAVLDADRDLGMVFCRVEQATDSRTPGYAPLFDITEDKVTSAWTRSLRPERLGIGAGMAVRRTALETIGGFDPFMGPGSRFPSADDREIALRMLVRGIPVAETASVVVQHYGHRSAGRAARSLTKRDFIAMGAMLAKFVRVRSPRAVRTAITFVLRLVWSALGDSIRRRRPTSLGKPVWAVVGLARGLRSPVDPKSIVYLPDTAT